MKKNGIILLLIAIITLTAVYFSNRGTSAEGEYLRIHVRANSNDFADQTVKYEVKDQIVSFLTPFVAECDTKSEAISLLKGKSDEIVAICNDLLKKEGFSYGAKVEIKKEYFPTRVYNGQTFDAGVYDAIIVELGSATGDNWWCVVYPPLCFVQSGKIEYRSKILEIISRFKNR